jgi:hypothetical protein
LALASIQTREWRRIASSGSWLAKYAEDIRNLEERNGGDNQWIGLDGKMCRKVPYKKWENRWFPVKMFPDKPIH